MSSSLESPPTSSRRPVDRLTLALAAAYLLAGLVGGLLAVWLHPFDSPGGLLAGIALLGLLALAGVVFTRWMMLRSGGAPIPSVSELRLRAVTSTLPDRVIILDSAGRYHDILKSEYDKSPIGKLVHKYGAAEGVRLQDIFPAEFADFCLEKVREVIDTARPQVFEYAFTDESGTYHLEGRVMPYHDPVTGEALVVWVSRDITARKQMETSLAESEALLRTVVRAWPDRAVIFDAEGHYQEVMQTAFNGGDEQEIIAQIEMGQRIQDHFPADFAAFCLDVIHKTLESGTAQVLEYPSPIHDEPKYFEARTIPFRDPRTGVPRVLWITRDITARKQAEQDRIALEVEHRHVEFLREFIGSMTHDLKAPVSTIKASLFLLGKSEDPELQARQRQKIEEQSDHLARLIDDILTVARLDHIPRLTLTEVMLDTLVERAREALTPRVEAKKLAVRYDLAADLPAIAGDADELYRAAVNLIENAITYTPEGGAVTVRIERTGDSVDLTVQDTGIGIGAEELPHIFERFYRASNAQAHPGGTGLGLAIVKRIVELHGGQVTADSTVGEGTTIRVTLPARAAG